MCDSDPCQPALLVMPGDESSTVKRFWATCVDNTGEEPTIDFERQQNLLELADAFARYPNFERAVVYLKALGGRGRRIRQEVHDLPFLRSGGMNSPGLVCGPVPSRQISRPHQLHVKFHRPARG